jgi:hypothetical protein
MIYEYSTIQNWWYTTTKKNDVVYDNIFVTYGDSNLITYLPFKRVKTSVFKETNSEYMVAFCKNAQFLELYNRLNRYAKGRFIIAKVA